MQQASIELHYLSMDAGPCVKEISSDICNSGFISFIS